MVITGAVIDAPSATPPVAAVDANARLVVALMALVSVMAPAPAAVSVKLKLAPLEAPLPVIA